MISLPRGMNGLLYFHHMHGWIIAGGTRAIEFPVNVPPGLDLRKDYPCAWHTRDDNRPVIDKVA